jgi:beta-galactosidase
LAPVWAATSFSVTDFLALSMTRSLAGWLLGVLGLGLGLTPGLGLALGLGVGVLDEPEPAGTGAEVLNPGWSSPDPWEQAASMSSAATESRTVRTVRAMFARHSDTVRRTGNAPQLDGLMSVDMPSPLLGGRLPHLLYGGDYNPEQWPEEVWAEDVVLMREAGVNLVCVGIFSWARLEPTPGTFEFGWLDRVLDLLHGGGMSVALATATASPPPWMAHRHPESLPQLADGTRLWQGGRQQYCPSSPVYREHAVRLVEALARRYGDHPAVVAWHAGNEYGCHVPACWCDVSAAAFRNWLRARYQTLEELNRSWGTDFWSQRYGDWEEVIPPRTAPTYPNPGQQLDFRRFCSDALLECLTAERDVLHRLTPELPVTTNLMGPYEHLDYWRWAEELDFCSHDSYPDPADPGSYVDAAMAQDLIRSLRGGDPWLLMEQTPGRVNWRRRNVAKRPGMMRRWSYQALARGADGTLFFQWRASRAGAEKFHSAMVPHGPLDRSRTWDEVRQLGSELSGLDAVIGTRVEATAAILVDWPSWWALELPSKPSGDVRLLEQIGDWYRALHRCGVTVDFVRAGADLSRYALVVVPNLYMVERETATRLESFVEGGGTLAVGFFSGIVDGFDQIHLGGYPAPLRRLLGVMVEDFRPLAEGEQVGLRFGDGPVAATGSLWSEIVHADGADVLATYAEGELAGLPAITRRGGAYYVSTRLDEGGLLGMVLALCERAGVRGPLPVPPEVEAVVRSGEGRRILFLLNHGGAETPVAVGEGAEVLIGTPADGETITLEPGGVSVIRLT